MSRILITGGHSGIGFEAAKTLASKYHRNIVLAGRSPERMTAAANELKKLADIEVTLLELDTSSMASVRAAAAKCKTDSFDAILCNAGGRFGKVEYSADGFERTFATNCLGHFLLTELLIDRVTTNGRVIFTTSGTHDPETLDGKLVGKAEQPDATLLANTGRSGAALSAGKRYTNSKLVDLMYAYELARRLKHAGSAITSTAFDPGSIPDSNFLREMPALVRTIIASSFMKWATAKMGITPGDLVFSGESLAKLAVDPAYEGLTQKYFQSNALRLLELRSSTLSYNEQLAQKLWNDSRNLAQLRPEEQSALLR
jgi:NAD(P)-dependent dehydrogenase (short-subunit alcohol dehydrogenase family)